MKNLLIAYTGNVCSSPFLGMFEYVEEFQMNTYENLDPYHIKNIFGEYNSDFLAERFLELHEHRLSKERRFLGISNPTGDKPVVLKWRPHKVGRSTKLATVLRENFIPFILVRKSVVEQGLKIVGNEIVFGTKWPQFRYTRQLKDSFEITEEVGKEILKESNTLVNWIKEIKETLEGFYKSPVPFVYAEDVFSPYVDVERFQEVVESVLGEKITINLPENFNPKTTALGSFTRKFQKRGVDMSKVKGLQEFMESDEVKRMEERYLKVVS